MEIPINRNEPLIMHIDLNSCFARVEQQANPLLRNKPVGVAAYSSPNGCVVSPSVEAKKLGVKVGMSVREARFFSPDIVILTPDPAKYRYVHQQFCRIFRDYSPDVSPKSIDEAIIDFAGSPILRKKTVEEVAQEIKDRIRKEIGCWISCSIGISTNRFLAKLAASLYKPDGLAVITHENLLDVLHGVTLTDLCGINSRYQARLNAAGIFTPTEFIQAEREKLIKQVFKSINGHHWYLRLRGWEVDAIIFGRKSFGNSYALGKQTGDPRELSRLLMKLCEKTGRRMRKAGFSARGIHVSCVYVDHTHWHQGRSLPVSMYTTQEIFTKAQLLLNRQPLSKKMHTLAVSCFDLQPANKEQPSLFMTDEVRQRELSDSIDKVNDRYGEFVITPALMLGMEQTILDRISFGGVRDLEEVYYDFAF